jgi:hypothetical protein
MATDIIHGLGIEKQHHAWRVFHASSGLEVAGGLRQKRFAAEAREDLLRTPVEWGMTADELHKSGALNGSEARETVALWKARARRDDLDPDTFEYYGWSASYGQEVPSAEKAAEYRAMLAHAVAELAGADEGGHPYAQPRGLTYWQALAVARSPHKSRVLAIKRVYRWGKFGENDKGEVTVTMMGNVIAVFTRHNVRLSPCGHAGPSTTEALTNLVTGGVFYTEKGVVYFERYGSGTPFSVTDVPGDARQGICFAYRPDMARVA